MRHIIDPCLHNTIQRDASSYRSFLHQNRHNRLSMAVRQKRPIRASHKKKTRACGPIQQKYIFTGLTSCIVSCVRQTNAVRAHEKENRPTSESNQSTSGTPMIGPTSHPTSLFTAYVCFCRHGHPQPRKAQTYLGRGYDW